MSTKQYDFEGWVTRNDLKCSDGRTIRRNAFAEQDGTRVPLIWNHNHDDPTNVLGHVDLENRPEGVWGYGSFNESELAQNAKLQVQHGDITAMSIWANRLQQNGGDVMHGIIREVSLVLAGANPGAYIQNVLSHGAFSEDEAILYCDSEINLAHADKEPEEKPEENNKKEAPKMSEEKTVQDVIDTMNEEQQTVLYALLGQVAEDAKNSNEEDADMKHNVFDTDYDTEENVLSHSDMEAIFSDAKRCGSLKEATLEHGITEIETLFPEPKLQNNPPEFIGRDRGWVGDVMSSVHKSPFSRIKSSFADITEDEARAKGYIKGNLKKEQVFSLLKRSTTPTTVYKKQKLDRDDVIDITDFDVVNWIRGEMRFQLEEELARAFLIGDGRMASDDDHINETNIRPIWKDEDLFTIKQRVTVPADTTGEERAKAYIKAAIRARKNYRGSGSPTFYTTEDVLTDMLLLEDEMGRIIYDSVSKLETMLRVKKIVTVPVMEDQSRSVDGTTWNLVGLIVNLADYNVGADKGGEVNMFDDFDIDYNRMKYLIETRCSGALTKPFSAIAIEMTVSNSASTITTATTTMQDGLAPYKPAQD